MNKKLSLVKVIACGLIIFQNDCNAREQQNNQGERPNKMNSQNNVITTPSGLKIEILEKTKDPKAKKAEKNKTVVVHYTGWLMKSDGGKGDQFDTSHKRNKPFSFELGKGQVIKGWDEGIAYLSVGDKARLIIPAQLGYGNRSIPGLIPANSTLIFDVELVDVV